MLLQVFTSIFIILQVAEGQMISPTPSHKSLSQVDKNSDQFFTSSKVKEAPRQQRLYQYPSNIELNLVQTALKSTQQSHQIDQTGGSMREYRKSEVKKSMNTFDDIEEGALGETRSDVKPQHHLKDNVKNVENTEYAVFKNHQHENQKVNNFNSKDHAYKKIFEQQSESQFTNREEKTLYITFLEVIDKIVKIFSIPQAAMELNNSSNYIGNQTKMMSEINQSEQLVKFPKDQVPENNFYSQNSSKQKLILPIRSYQVERESQMIDETKLLMKRRKKLYFIICTLSFGSVCIFLIKFFDERDGNKKQFRQGVVKIPTEQFYIQQI